MLEVLYSVTVLFVLSGEWKLLVAVFFGKTVVFVVISGSGVLSCVIYGQILKQNKNTCVKITNYVVKILQLLHSFRLSSSIDVMWHEEQE